jgi:hypothetical protein
MKNKKTKTIVTRVLAGLLILAMVFPCLSSISLAAEEPVATEEQQELEEKKEEETSEAAVVEEEPESEKEPETIEVVPETEPEDVPKAAAVEPVEEETEEETEEEYDPYQGAVIYYIRKAYQCETPNTDQYEYGDWEKNGVWAYGVGEEFTIEADWVDGFIRPADQSIILSENADENRVTFYYDRAGSWIGVGPAVYSSDHSGGCEIAYAESYTINASSLNIPTGYEFDYFTLDGEKVDGDSVTVYGDSADHEIKICVKAITYTIVYEDCEDAENPNPATFTPDNVPILTYPAKDGYKFIGWDVKGNIADEYGGMIIKDFSIEQYYRGYENHTLTLKAVWAKDDEVTYIVYSYCKDYGETEYKLYGGDGLPRVFTGAVGEEIQLDSWNIFGYEYPEQATACEDEPGIYTYSYYYDPIYVTVNVSADEGVTVSGGGDFYAGQTTTLSAVVADGYEFTGWKLWTISESWTESEQTFDFTVIGEKTFALATAKKVANTDEEDSNKEDSTKIDVNFDEFTFDPDEVTVTKAEYSKDSKEAAAAVDVLKDSDIVFVETSTYRVFDVSLYDENGNAITDEFGKLTLTFPVDESDNGKAATIYHIHNGKVVNTVQTTVEDGAVDIQVSQLSTFVVVIDEAAKKTETPSEEKKEEKVEEKKDTPTTSTPAATTGTSATQATETVNTGDHSNLLLWAVLASLGLAVSIFTVRRYKKKVR